MSDLSPGISLVYPMYNERANIAQAVAHGAHVLSSLAAEWEIVVVDDGSGDESAAIVARLAREEPRVRLISRSRNEGLGAALRDGFSAARHEVVLYCDSDLPYDLSILARALPLLGESDLVAGFRLNHGESALRIVYSKAYNLLIKTLFGLPVRDVNFSFKLFKRHVLQKIQLESRGSFIDAEFLIKTRNAGLRLAEIGIVYTHRRHGISKLSSLATIVEMLGELGRQWKFLASPCGYRPAGLRDMIHTSYRWRSCPFEFLESLVPTQGKILDFGCGHGLFAHWLSVRSLRRDVTAWDPDARKIDLACRRLPALPNLSFRSGAEFPIMAPSSLTAVTAIDVLAYLTAAEKDAFVRSCRESLAPGGVLLIKEIDMRPRWKYAWTRLQEGAALAMGLTQTPSGSTNLHFEKADRHRVRLESLGFEVRLMTPKTRLPYSHVVITGIKAR
ncbi:MAG: glycosyltransferase [Elusimicrobiota bacterium]